MGKSGKRMKLLMAKTSDQAKVEDMPGTYLGQTDDGGLRIQAGDGVVSIGRIQPAGKKPMAAQDFLNGKSLMAGQLLSDQI